MADVFYGVDVGGHHLANVTVQGSSPSKNVELVVDNAVVVPGAPGAKEDILLALDAIREAVMRHDY